MKYLFLLIFFAGCASPPERPQPTDDEIYESLCPKCSPATRQELEAFFRKYAI